MNFQNWINPVKCVYGMYFELFCLEKRAEMHWHLRVKQCVWIDQCEQKAPREKTTKCLKPSLHANQTNSLFNHLQLQKLKVCTKVSLIHLRWSWTFYKGNLVPGKLPSEILKKADEITGSKNAPLLSSTKIYHKGPPLLYIFKKIISNRILFRKTYD